MRELLLTEPGVAHVALLSGVLVKPEGDVVEAVLTRECADRVLQGLVGIGLDRQGGITLESFETVLSKAADTAEELVPGDPADAVVWDELIERTGADSRLTIGYLAFLTIACLLAAIGVVTDSSVTVVGAMVLGPEFGPLAAMAVGLVARRRDLVNKSVIALFVGFPVAMGLTAGTWLVFHTLGLVNKTSLDQLTDVDFIYQVGPFSLIVALLAGAAGMLSLTSGKSSALVGVFISVTTVPAAAFATIATVEGRWDRVLSSSVQLLVNLVGIVLAAVAVLVLSRLSRPFSALGQRCRRE
ncbi:MAG TPA: DUF389 domain-containing protein [Pseudonocardia sp.]|nr:DUF389 domain-containing protein [Pseudonocardia sp.]